MPSTITIDGAGDDAGDGAFIGGITASSAVAPASGQIINRTTGWIPVYEVAVPNILNACTLTITSQQTGQIAFGPATGTALADALGFHRLTWLGAGAIPVGVYNYLFQSTRDGAVQTPETGVLNVSAYLAPHPSSTALFTSQFTQVGFGSNQVINPQLPVIARPTNTGLSIAWRLVGAGAALGGATATSVCRLYGSLNLTTAFTGIQITFLKDERDMVLSLLLPAALPVVLPGIASDYLFWASISTVQGIVMTAPILVTAVS